MSTRPGLSKRLLTGANTTFSDVHAVSARAFFLSTLKCFFEGKRHLFKDLYADEMDWEWDGYPVLFLDLNIEKYKIPDTLDAVLLNNIISWEKEYDIKPEILSWMTLSRTSVMVM